VSSSIVLIASSEYLPRLKEREDLAQATSFTDSDALRALDTITRQRPQVIAIERMFAASSRGAALVNRIKADPSLDQCEIRIVAHDTEYSRVSPRRYGEGQTTSISSVAVIEAPPSAAPPLDQKGTRRAPRFRIVEGVEVQIDGNVASLIDLSVVGAQVLSPTILKPNQRVRVTLPISGRPLRFSAAVAWASFEIPKGGPRYRAGIEFFDADADSVSNLIETKKA
jgi:hypothetical protein